MNAASCALDATQLILSSRLSTKVFPTKHNYSFLRQNIVILFLERKETYTRWNRIRDSTFCGRFDISVSSIATDRSRFSSRGPTLPTEKSRTTYIYRHVYICTYVCVYVCVCVCDSRIFIISLFCILVVTVSFFFFFLCGYVRIIATNISHRPTFRSTTQHNHCRISLRFFLLFFIFSPFLLTSDRFPHR